MKTQSATSTSSTSDVSQQQPQKTDSKPPQKEFKKVLDDQAGEAQGKDAAHGKGGQHGKGALHGKLKGPFLKHEKEKAEHGPMTAAGRKPIHGKGDSDDAGEMGFSKKDEKAKKPVKEELKPFTVPNMMMGPSTIQNKAEIQKAHGPALNIKEIESIVQKVQVGMNEKGLPEMNFELMTDKLGPLTLKISSENEKVKIQFVAQDASAQAELQKGMNELTQLLGQRGLNLSETNVMTRDQQSQQQQQGDSRGDDSGSASLGETAKGRAKKRNVPGRSDDGFTI
jgi:flagellar hook-length control protein FliK